jgi:hypothetical protein
MSVGMSVCKYGRVIMSSNYECSAVKYGMSNECSVKLWIWVCVIWSVV